ncbi:hypothetical protein N7481_004893 [Penicillium waksmanii]|uniref:uncharacterized protein n=1 Tax=Penicillium waksmanii TaxID=69791 RepID=UPI002546EF0D|nr:uncharacterized protein N7481_004893 [Penicillium waksmanii]KAJ5989683.1 hypothetical protein N7481_004893 [Penicillium waksmanii]
MELNSPIESLEAFPLCYHPSYKQVRKDLVGRGQKFRDLAGLYIRYCKGNVFFISKGKIFKPNYSRPSLCDIGVKEKDGITVIDIGAIFMEDCEREKERMRGDGLDVECVVSALRDIDWLSELFDYLQILSDTKTMLLLLAKMRLGLIPTVPFDDVIDGKG